MEKSVGLVARSSFGAGYWVLVHTRKLPGSNLVLELAKKVFTISEHSTQYGQVAPPALVQAYPDSRYCPWGIQPRLRVSRNP
jgi:hypothetical protein